MDDGVREVLLDTGKIIFAIFCNLAHRKHTFVEKYQLFV